VAVAWLQPTGAHREVDQLGADPNQDHRSAIALPLSEPAHPRSFARTLE
jgi:hypothetical protein